MNGFSPRRPIVIYGFLILLSLALIVVGRSGPVTEMRNGIRFALGPVQEVLAGGADGVSSLLGAFTEIDQLRKENRSLADQVARLEQQIVQLDVLRAENDRLSSLLGTRKALDYESVAANVVQRSPSAFERLVSIDRGSEAGIEVNDAVLAPGGALVGMITEVFDGGATVRLLSDTRSLVIGVDVATNATGEVTGDLSQPLKLEKVAATDKISVGDTVTTAGQLVDGVKSILPRSLLIGTIVDVLDPEDFTRSGRIIPAVDLDRQALRGPSGCWPMEFFLH